MNDWAVWLGEVSGGESASLIASKVGTNRSSFARWFSSGRPPCSVVFSVARLYDADVLVGLWASGWIDGDQLEPMRRRILLGTPTRDLIDELHERAGHVPARESFHDPNTDPTRLDQ